MRSVDTPVLIVGGGPIGLTIALLLAHQGVRSMVIERKPTTSAAPRAHVINRRTMEIYRELGLDASILAASTRPQNMRNVVWADTLAGEEIGRFLAWGLDPERLRSTAHLSPLRVVNFPQHRLEPLLREAAEDHQLIDVHFSSELQSFEDDGASVTASILFPDGVRSLQTNYLIGADGGRSEVREALGISFEGSGGLRSAVNAYFTADLSRWMSERPGLLYLLLNPQSTGVLIGASVPDQWVFMRPLPPGAPASLPSIETVSESIRAAVGVPNLQLSIHEVQTWNTNALVAESYGRGRVWLAGDAAHLNSPTGGLGLNTGVQDAHGLAWRLAALLHGWADQPVLLDYERERQGVGRTNVEQSLRNLQLLSLVREAVDLPAIPSPGIEPGMLASRIAELRDESQDGRRRRARVSKAIAAQYEQLDALGIDLGFRYQLPTDEAALPPTPEDTIRDYLPTTFPGSRLPHAWVEVEGRRVSTLDLVGRGTFTLIVGEEADGWHDIVRTIDDTIPLTVVAIGATCSAFDLEGRWEELRGIAPAGAILVRPDGHVAWRAEGPDVKVIHALKQQSGRLASRHGGSTLALAEA